MTFKATLYDYKPNGRSWSATIDRDVNCSSVTLDFEDEQACREYQLNGDWRTASMKKILKEYGAIPSGMTREEFVEAVEKECSTDLEALKFFIKSHMFFIKSHMKEMKET